MRDKIKVSDLDVVHLNESTLLLRLERNGFMFQAGQYLVLNVPGERKAREYSIFSGQDEPYIELLIKEIEKGEVSKELKYIKIGTALQISGPYGFFILDEQVKNRTRPVVFVASGTGISPFHSMVRSYPSVRCTAIHGIRYSDETFGKGGFPAGSFLSCTSRDGWGNYHGRVTDYLSAHGVDLDAYYYLCGNSAMVSEVIDLLEKKGLPPSQIKTEVFF
jgi:NAD(P)H-flavin reductase